MLVGYIVIDATLYFFVFEMQFVAAKLECNSIAEYQRVSKQIRVRRAVTIGALLLIYGPACNAGFIFSTTNFDPELYWDWIIACLIVTRIVFSITEGYVYYLFAS